MLKGIFITGTDTDIGKSWIGTQLVASLFGKGIRVTARKPVESGCQSVDGQLVANDAQGYFNALGGTIPAERICPYRYEAALAPPTAARQAGHELRLESLLDACRSHSSALLVVEGAGGFYSPIATDGVNADLAQALGLPILLVAANRLGCINHVLLTQEAIARRGLNILAIVLTETKVGMALPDNREMLAKLQPSPVITVGYQQRLDVVDLFRVSGHPLERLDHWIR